MTKKKQEEATFTLNTVTAALEAMADSGLVSGKY